MELTHDFFEENLALLQEYHPHIWQQVKDYEGEPLGEFCLAEDGRLTLLVTKESGNVFIHDQKNPEAELEGYYGRVPEGTTGVVVFLGMGLGYSPQAMLLTRSKVRHLAVLEPKIGFFVQALHAQNLSSFLSDRRVIIAIGSDIDIPSVMQHMELALALENIHILNHLPEAEVFPEVYENLYEEVFKHANSCNIGGLTTRTHGRQFSENRLRHLSAIHHQCLLEHLQGSFVDVPAIIVAGGPSLNKNIHILPKAKGKAIIIAADTVLPALLKHGVTPEFTTTIDMQKIVLEKIVDVSAEAKDTSLVCAAWVHPAIPKTFPARQVYWTFAAKHMEMWINDLLGGKILTGGAGTVAHLSFTTAFMLGCSPIIFVGQDLAFTDQQDHAHDTSLTQKGDLENFFGNKDQIQWVNGYGGGKVPTDRGWLSDKNHFERLIAGHDDRHFINATEGGVRIEGTEELSLQETITRYCQNDVAATDIIKDSDSKSDMAGQRRMVDEFRRLSKASAVIETDLGQLENLIRTVEKEIDRLQTLPRVYKTFDSLPEKLKQQINQLDTLHAKLDSSKIWALLDDVTMDGLFESERINYDIQQLEDKQEYYLDYLHKNCERFQIIKKCRRQVLVPFKNMIHHLYESFQREKVLLHKITKKRGESKEPFLELLRLYYKNKDYVLMGKMIEKYPNSVDSAELTFYLGVIAAHQSQFKQAVSFFSRAIELDATFANQITECRKRLGDQYLGFQREWLHKDRDVACRMLFKGLRHCPEHKVVREEIIAEAKRMLIKVNASANDGTLSKQEDQLSYWCQELSANDNLVEIIDRESAASIFRYHGNIQVTKQDFTKAAASIKSAIDITPQAPDLHLILSDISFAQSDFINGIAHLDNAVALDKQYASYWENLGDSLAQNDQAEDAILAYERCFLALPENFGILKKIGDCYMTINHPQAALETYNQLKAKYMSLAEAECTIPQNATKH